MVGVDEKTKGGMWTVVENYLTNKFFCENVQLSYIATSITGSVPKKIVFTAISLMKILHVFIYGNIDIVHIHMSERGSVYRKSIIIQLAKIFDCKIVLHLHGAEFESWYGNLKKMNKKYVRNTLNKADKIIILGEYWKLFMSSLVQDTNKVTVIYNAVEVPDKYLYSNNCQNLLFLGVVGKRKGIDDLLEAIKLLDVKLDTKIKLWIYGPDFENTIENKISTLKLHNRVEYKGWLSKNSKSAMLKEIAINILPSYNEGLPMTILETMAFGIPNISTNVAAIPEAVNNSNGIIVEAGDVIQLANAIEYLMTNDQEREKRSLEAYDTAKNRFSLTTHLNELLGIYDELEKNR